MCDKKIDILIDITTDPISTELINEKHNELLDYEHHSCNSLRTTQIIDLKDDIKIFERYHSEADNDHLEKIIIEEIGGKI